MSYSYDERPQSLHRRLCATSDCYRKLENGFDLLTSSNQCLWEARQSEAVERRHTASQW